MGAQQSSWESQSEYERIADVRLFLGGAYRREVSRLAQQILRQAGTPAKQLELARMAAREAMTLHLFTPGRRRAGTLNVSPIINRAGRLFAQMCLGITFQREFRDDIVDEVKRLQNPRADGSARSR